MEILSPQSVNGQLFITDKNKSRGANTQRLHSPLSPIKLDISIGSPPKPQLNVRIMRLQQNTQSQVYNLNNPAQAFLFKTSGLKMASPISEVKSLEGGLNFGVEKRVSLIQKQQIQKKYQENKMRTAKENRQSLICIHLAQIRHIKNESILQIMKKFIVYTNELIKSKNERYMINFVMKHSTYNPKIRELMGIFPPKPTLWTPESLIKSIVSHGEEGVHFKVHSEMKKFRLDSALIDALVDLTKILENTIMVLKSDRLNNEAESHINRQNQVIEKEKLVKCQIMENKKSQQLEFLNEMISARKPLNIRILQTDIMARLCSYEEKNGDFPLIHNLTRNTSNKIDMALEKIKIQGVGR